MPTTNPSADAQTYPAVVIGRQFGSGGRRIGRLVAQRFGMDYYDKELLSEAAGDLGLDKQLFADSDEKRPSPLRSLLQGMYGVADNFNHGGMSGETLYTLQGDVIKKLSRQRPCVFVGRTADYVLRHHPGLVSVFLHAPLDERARRIVRRGEAPDLEAARDAARRHDRDRENYYNYYTGRHWGRADNYHLSIDASKFDDETILSLIGSVLKMKTVK